MKACFRARGHVRLAPEGPQFVCATQPKIDDVSSTRHGRLNMYPVISQYTVDIHTVDTRSYRKLVDRVSHLSHCYDLLQQLIEVHDVSIECIDPPLQRRQHHD